MITAPRLLEAASVATLRALLTVIASPAEGEARLNELVEAKAAADDQLLRAGAREAALERREASLRDRETAVEQAERRAAQVVANADAQLTALRSFDRQVDDRLELIAVREAQIKAVVARLSRSEFAGIIEDPGPPLVKPDGRGKSAGSQRTQFRSVEAHGGAA